MLQSVWPTKVFTTFSAQPYTCPHSFCWLCSYPSISFWSATPLFCFLGRLPAALCTAKSALCLTASPELQPHPAASVATLPHLLPEFLLLMPLFCWPHWQLCSDVSVFVCVVPWLLFLTLFLGWELFICTIGNHIIWAGRVWLPGSLPPGRTNFTMYEKSWLPFFKASVSQAL